MDTWQLAAGSTIGRNHRVSGRNNQDAWNTSRSCHGTVAIIADGCGSGQQSEVGAQLAVQLLATEIQQQLSRGRRCDLRAAERHVLSHFDVLLGAVGLPYEDAVVRYALFTTLGAIITDEETIFFGCGDGTIVLDGSIEVQASLVGNQPPYIGYQLIEGVVDVDEATIRLREIARYSAGTLDTFLLGTDGVDDLCRHEQSLRPGLSTVVGPLDQFWCNDRYFAENTELINRELRLIARDWPRNDPTPGLLRDDTTIIVGRRMPLGKEGESCHR